MAPSAVPQGLGPRTGPVPLDRQVRVTMAHACVQVLAERHRIDLLHVKGPALDPSLRADERTSSDADVLVRPVHVAILVGALRESGWRGVTDFRSGSVFEHGANYHHDDWGYLDLHRSFPGITRDATSAFDALWSERGTADLAHRSCPVPSVRDQALLLCLHAARGFADARSRSDLDHAWYAEDPAGRDRIRARAEALGAEVALAAAIGELDRHDDRTVALWRYFSEGGSRLDEWRARWLAAPTWRERARVAARAVAVNRDYTAMTLGHRPSRTELVRASAGRLATAGRLVGARLDRGVRRDDRRAP